MIRSSPHETGKIPSLDGLRAISVALVVLSHVGFGRLIPGGLGVTIFFFLSGYLITTLLIAERNQTNRVDIPRFYARRLFRLMPPLLVTLLIAYALTTANLLPGSITLLGFAAQVLYFANYYALFYDGTDSGVPGGTGILWSLAVEEHYYIFYPLILASMARFRNLAMLLVGLCVAVLLWRNYLAHLPGFTEVRTYYASDTRIDSIIYGALLAILKNPLGLSRKDDPPTARDWLIFIGALAVLGATLAYRGAIFRETLRYTLQGLALMPIFYFCIRFHNIRSISWLNWPWLAKIGQYSYAIYLIHFIIISFIGRNEPGIGARPLPLLMIVCVLSLAYAEAIDRWVDPYFRSLRHKYRAAKATDARVLPATI